MTQHSLCTDALGQTRQDVKAKDQFDQGLTFNKTLASWERPHLDRG